LKRLIAAAVLLIIVVTTYICSYIYIDKTCKTANKMLSECVDIYSADQNATDSAKKLNKFWSKKEKPLSIIANHSSIDEIEMAIGSLVSYSNSPENEIFYEYAGTVKTLLHQLMEDTKPGIHSIF